MVTGLTGLIVSALLSQVPATPPSPPTAEFQRQQLMKALDENICTNTIQVLKNGVVQMEIENKSLTDELSQVRRELAKLKATLATPPAPSTPSVSPSSTSP